MKSPGFEMFAPLCVPLMLAGLAMTGCAPALCRAASRGQIDVVRSLLDKGADADDWAAGPPLWCAASNGQTEAAKLLIARGADVNVMDDRGSSALGYAAMRGDARMAKVLIDSGADVDAAVAGLEKNSALLASYPEVVARNTMGIKLLEKAVHKQEAASRPAAPTPRPAQEASPAPGSDVDEPPAAKVKPDQNAHAIVIGIENYRQGLPKADYAAADAKTISAYLTKTMGYPEENVVTLLNDRALKSDLEKYLDRWLSNHVEENGRVFIYYSGHGSPNVMNGDAYLVPYDGDPTFIAETGYPLARLYASLGKLKAKEITVVLDSCFSGAGGRSVLAKGAKPLVVMTQKPIIPKNASVMTASAADQVSSAYEAQGHGLFTYFLLKGIKEGDVVKPDGSIKMDELFGYVKPRVERLARQQFNNEQTPQLTK